MKALFSSSRVMLPFAILSISLSEQKAMPSALSLLGARCSRSLLRWPAVVLSQIKRYQT